MSRAAAGPLEADQLLAREYEQLKPEVLRTVAGKLAASGARLPDADLDAFYNDAWHGLYMKLTAGERVENRKGLLVTIAHRRALNEHRALRPSRRADPDELGAVGVEPDVEGRLDDEAKLRQLIEGMRERLDLRERQAAALCYLYDYSRPEAARAIGVTPKRMEKIMDGVSKHVRDLVGEIRIGTRCSSYDSLMRAYAVGLLDEQGERYRLARNHLDECSACRHHVRVVRGIAAIAPPAPLLLAGAAGAGGSAGAPAASQAVGGARAARRAARLGRKAVAGGAAAAVVVAVAVAALTSGGRDAPAPAPTTGAVPSPPPASPSSGARVGSGVAERRRRAAQERRRARRRARQSQAARPPVADPPAAAPSPAPPAAQTPAAVEPPPVSQEPVRDGAEEFELR